MVGWRNSGFGIFGLACVIAALGSLAGCGTTAKVEKVDLVWPAPPEQPRVRYLTEYRGEADFSRDDFKDALLGEERGGLALVKPYGVTTTPDGDTIYVTDTRLPGVMVFDLKRQRAGVFQTDARGGLRGPVDIRRDSRGRLYVSDSDRGEVLIYGPDGETLMALGKREEMGRATGLALDEKKDRLYVADTNKHRILVYDLGGKLVQTFGERGSEPGQFNFPVNLALDRSGNLLVTDSGNFRIQIFDGEGKYLRAFGQIGDSFGSFTRPKGVAVDSEGNVYVVDAAFNNFQIFNAEGRILLFVGGAGADAGKFWLPAGIHVDSNDKIYVVDSINARVQVFQYLKSPDAQPEKEGQAGT